MNQQRVAYRLGMISDSLSDHGIDGLVFFGREIEHDDHLMYQLIGAGLSGRHAIVVRKEKRPIVVAGVHDAGNVPKELYDVVEWQYEDDPSNVLAKTISDVGITRLGLATSEDISVIDTLTLGMYLKLEQALRTAGRGVVIDLEAGENVLYSAFARRTPDEIEGLRRAVKITDEIFDAAEQYVLKDGKTEKEIASFFHDQMERRGVKSSWASNSCPIVAVKNNSVRGHHMPGNDVVTPGYVVFTDFGVKDPETNMPADLQRTYFLVDPINGRATERVEKMFRLQARARDAAIAKMVPGAKGLEVDAAGRNVIVSAGYKQFNHALGHTLSAEGNHGIGPLAAVPMPRYGNLPYRPLEAGMVLTSEPSVIDPEGVQGRISSEYDVLVTDGVPEVLNKKQDEV